MLNALGLGFIFRAKDDTKEVIERLHGNLDDLKKAGESSSKSITGALGVSAKFIAGASLAIGAVATAAAFEFAEHAERFSSAITQAGVASHATAEQMRDLEELARGKAMDSLRGSAITTAEALRDLAKEGMDANDAGKALDGTLMLMRISMGALGSADAAAIVNDSLKQFGMNSSQAGELTDKLAFAMKNFGFRAEELRGTMSGLAAGAQLTHASLDDTLIAVGLVKEVFPSATKAAMSMNMAMQQLASTKAQKELRGIGVAVTDNHGKIKPLIEIIDQLASRTVHMTEAQLSHKLETIAGGRAAGGLSAVIEGLRKGVKDANGQILTGSAAVAYLREQMASTSGTAKKMSEMLGDTLGGSITALKNAVSNAGVEIGKAFENPFKHLIQDANLVVRGLTQLFTQGGFTGEVREALDKRLGLKGFVEGIFIWVKRIQNFFSSLADSFEETFGPFKPMLDELLGTFSDLGHALGITSQSADDNTAVWNTFGGAGSGVGAILGTIVDTILPALVAGMHIVVGAIELTRAVLASLGGEFGGIWQAFKGVFNLIGGLLTGNWKQMWDGFVDVVVGASKAVIKLVLGAMGSIAGIIDSVGSAFGQDFGLKGSIAGMQDAVNSGAIDRGTKVVKDLVSPTAPAVASQNVQIKASAEQQAAAQQALKSMGLDLTGFSGGDVVVHSHVHMDGEKVAEGISKAKRSRDSRSFHSVPAGEGAF